MPSDFQALLDLDQRCFEPGIAYSAEELSDFVTLPHARTVIAERSGQLLGFIVVAAYPRRSSKAKTGHIITIDVEETGRRSGAGTALMEAGERKLVELGCDQVFLEVAQTNQAAISFYLRLGYRLFRELPKYYKGKIDGYLMGKLLAASPVGEAEKTP